MTPPPKWIFYLPPATPWFSFSICSEPRLGNVGLFVRFLGDEERTQHQSPCHWDLDNRDTKPSELPSLNPATQVLCSPSTHCLQSLSLVPQICSLLKGRESRGCGHCGNPNAGVQTPWWQLKLILNTFLLFSFSL